MLESQAPRVTDKTEEKLRAKDAQVPLPAPTVPQTIVNPVELSRETESTIHTPTRRSTRILRMSSNSHATVIEVNDRVTPRIVIRIA